MRLGYWPNVDSWLRVRDVMDVRNDVGGGAVVTICVNKVLGHLYRSQQYLNTLLLCNKSFVEAFKNLSTHRKLTEEFIFSENTVQQAHGHAMHYLNQYLSLYGLPSASQTPHPLSNQLLSL